MSIIRVLAFFMIIICHFMQYFNVGLAWWFNVGVQIFLCLSGYLYGRKEISEDIVFYKKQFVKILVPYYLVVIAVICVQALFFKEQISFTQAIKSLFVYGTLSGGEHLWFIPTILFCYTLTPVIDRINAHIFERNHVFLRLSTVFLALSISVGLFVSYFNPAWIACYYIGNVLGKSDVKKVINKSMRNGMLYALAVGLVAVQISISYIFRIEFKGYLQTFYGILCNYGHTFLGVSIVILMLDLLGKMHITNLCKLISFLDSISYEGYLVHQFFILGPLSFLNCIQPVAAIPLILGTTVVLGMLIKVVGGKIKYSMLLKVSA